MDIDNAKNMRKRLDEIIEEIKKDPDFDKAENLKFSMEPRFICEKEFIEKSSKVITQMTLDWALNGLDADISVLVGETLCFFTSMLRHELFDE